MGPYRIRTVISTGATMATCNLCPPESREVPDEAMADHLHTVHPDVADDGTRESDGSTIEPTASLEPAPADRTGTGEWHG
jgi:hypothetical protein